MESHIEKSTFEKSLPVDSRPFYNQQEQRAYFYMSFALPAPFYGAQVIINATPRICRYQK